MEFEAPNYPMVLAVAAPAFLVLLGIEWFLISRRRIGGHYDRKDAFTCGFGNFVSLIGDLVSGRH